VSEKLRLMGVLAHPDDESLGMGGTFLKYASEGVETFVVTATRGEAGRFRGSREGPDYPGPEALGRIREAELRAAARALGVREVSLLGYLDQQLDRAEPREAIGRIAGHIRRVRPQVIVTFDPTGGYGHPDHIAICQFATAAVVAAADASVTLGGPDAEWAAHAVSKLYDLAWPEPAAAAYEEAFRKMTSMVDGVERESPPWPEWAITTVIDTKRWWEGVWTAVSCHESQITAYEKLRHLSPRSHEALWGWQSFYRVFSTVNGGRGREDDLFAGLR
jgi:LmbE family N-acetylglucosaminyl deacetylase